MTSFLAAATTEIRRQLTSSVTWIAIAVFALISGAALVTHLSAFLDLSVTALTAPPVRPVNINQLLIRPFLVEAGMAALLVLPLVTARASNMRRAALPAIVASFTGVMAVYTVMLVITLAPILVLFIYGAPEWGPIASGYLGLVLVGAAFSAAALFVSSLATSVVPALIATWAVSLAVIATTWLARSAVPSTRAVFRQLAVGQALDDFAKGVVDVGPVVTCLTIVAVALFLTVQSLERKPVG